MHRTILVLLVLASACSTPEDNRIQQHSKKSNTRTSNTVRAASVVLASNKTIAIGVIDSIPDEMYGAGCAYSINAKDRDKGNNFLLTRYDDGDRAAGLMVNGTLEFFSEVKTIGNSQSEIRSTDEDSEDVRSTDTTTFERDTEMYTNNKWTVIVNTTSSKPGADYTSEHEGSIRVINSRTSDTLTVPFFGECGC